MNRIIKNRIVSLVLFVIGVLILFMYLKNTGVAVEKLDQVLFFTDNHAEEEDFLISRFDFIAQCIRANENVSGQMFLGKPISVIGTTALYVPVYKDGKCRWIITVGKKDGEIFLNWRKGFADILNELESGRYYFKLEDNGDTYVIGTGRKILIESEYNRDQIGTILSDDSEIRNVSEMQFVNISDSVWINEEGPMRSVQTACLNMDNPSFPNGGMYGYCWLCTACDISKFLGGSNVDLDVAHALVHGTYAQGSHSKIYCTGGSIDDMEDIVNYYTQKTGNFCASSLSISSVISEIQGSKPIASGWNYGNNWHMMVVCGYSYDNSTGVVAYIIKDSNYNEEYCYAYGMDNSSVVNYYINGHAYVWSESLYNWH